MADRFHVIRLINLHFVACWREIDRSGSQEPRPALLMRRHRHNLKPDQRLEPYFDQFPALREIYRSQTATPLFAAEKASYP